MTIGYQNVGGGIVNAHGFLERCHEKGVHIVFIGECWINNSGNGTTIHGAYTLGTRIQKGRRETVYWKKELEDMIKMVMEEGRVMGIEVAWKKIFGVYGKSASTSADYLSWLESIERKFRNWEGALVGDWNTYHRIWKEGDWENRQGRTLQEWTTEEAYELVKLEGPTSESTGDGQQKASRIDLIFTKATGMWEHSEKKRLTSDHWALFGQMEVGMDIGSQVRKVID